MHIVVIDNPRDFQKITLTTETMYLKEFGFQRNANKIKLHLIVKLFKNISRIQVSNTFLKSYWLIFFFFIFIPAPPTTLSVELENPYIPDLPATVNCTATMNPNTTKVFLVGNNTNNQLMIIPTNNENFL